MNIIAYPIGVIGANGKLFGYTRPCSSGFKSSLNLIDVRLFKFGVTSKFPTFGNVSSNSPRMTQVLALCNPFKVADVIVQLVGIFVIYLRSIRRVWNKIECYQTMYQYIPRLGTRSVAQGYSCVTECVNAPFKKFGCSSTAPTTKSPRTNLACFSNFVQSFVTLNRCPMFSIHKPTFGSIMGYVNV